MTSSIEYINPTSEVSKAALLARHSGRLRHKSLTPAAEPKSKQSSRRALSQHKVDQMQSNLFTIQTSSALTTSRSSAISRRRSSRALPTMLRRVHFDFNGNGVDARTRSELNCLMKQLLQKRQNCCLLRFSNQRRCSMLFLYHLLVQQVDKVLNLLPGKLIKIHLTYMYLRRHDTCNAFRKVFRSKESFNTTLQLYKWLDREYSTLFGSGLRHECFHIELEYMTRGEIPAIHKADLVILQLYLHRMDDETRQNLCTMLRKPTEVKDDSTNKVTTENYFFLRDYLRQYLNGGNQWSTWIFFDVSNNGADVNADLLKLAKASYAGLKAEKEMLFKRLNEDNKRPMRVAGGGVNKELFFIKPPPKHRKIMEKFGDWIQRIDERFDNVLCTLKEYYNCKYELKIAKVTEFMRQIANPKLPIPKELGSDISISADLTWYYNRYKVAQTNLENFLEEIEHSGVKNDLMPYLQLKVEQLERNASEHKVQQLKVCKARLTDVINGEIEMLQGPVCAMNANMTKGTAVNI